MIIGITGTDGAGKGTAVDYLLQQGFTHYSVREVITQEILRRGLSVNRPHMKQVGNDLRAQFGGDVLVTKTLEQAKDSGVVDCVIESIRTVSETKTLHERGGKLLVVDADQRVRYERIVSRGSETDQLTFDEFVEQEVAESISQNPDEQNKMLVMQLADHTIMNDGTVEELHTQVAKWLARLRG